MESNQVKVQYLNQDTDKVVVLSDIQMEIIGLTKTDTDWNVTILTSSGIKKLQHNVSDTLEVLGFTFKDLQTAIAVQNFIVQWLEDLDKPDKPKEKHADDV